MKKIIKEPYSIRDIVQILTGVHFEIFLKKQSNILEVGIEEAYDQGMKDAMKRVLYYISLVDLKVVKNSVEKYDSSDVNDQLYTIKCDFWDLESKYTGENKNLYSRAIRDAVAIIDKEMKKYDKNN